MGRGGPFCACKAVNHCYHHSNAQAQPPPSRRLSSDARYGYDVCGALRRGSSCCGKQPAHAYAGRVQAPPEADATRPGAISRSPRIHPPATCNRFCRRVLRRPQGERTAPGRSGVLYEVVVFYNGGRRLLRESEELRWEVHLQALRVHPRSIQLHLLEQDRLRVYCRMLRICSL